MKWKFVIAGIVCVAVMIFLVIDLSDLLQKGAEFKALVH